MNKKSRIYLAELDKKLTFLLRDLKSYSDVKLNEQPSDTEWSVLQIMQHLMKAENMAIGYVKKKLSFNSDLKKANLQSTFRFLFLQIALSAPFRIKAPMQISGAALEKNLTFWEVAKKWKAQRDALESYLESLPEEYFSKELYKHPMSGKMTLTSMLSFFIKIKNFKTEGQL